MQDQQDCDKEVEVPKGSSFLSAEAEITESESDAISIYLCIKFEEVAPKVIEDDGGFPEAEIGAFVLRPLSFSPEALGWHRFIHLLSVRNEKEFREDAICSIYLCIKFEEDLTL
jgi:hypothetical protein